MNEHAAATPPPAPEDEDAAAGMLRHIKACQKQIAAERAARRDQVAALEAQRGGGDAPPSDTARLLDHEIPAGYTIWFHTHSLPEIFQLSSSKDTHKLLTPPPDAPPLNPHLPVGVFVAVDDAAITAALQGNSKLEMQMERLVGPGHLSPREFWINYFAHVHDIKTKMSARAWVWQPSARTCMHSNRASDTK